MGAAPERVEAWLVRVGAWLMRVGASLVKKRKNGKMARALENNGLSYSSEG